MSNDLQSRDLNFFRNETVFQRRLRLSNLLFNTIGSRIKYGPYSGIQLVDNINWGRADLGSILLGIYELEVVEYLSTEVVDRNRFIDIGAGDGLHAVAALKNLGFETVVAYEIDLNRRNTIQEMADLNSVGDKITIRGDIFDKERTDLTNSCILIDIEGAELKLLDDDFAARVGGSTLIVEMHTWVQNFWGKWTAIERAFGCSWEICYLPQGSRNPNSFEELRSWPDDNRFLLCSEGRRELGQWAIFKPR